MKNPTLQSISVMALGFITKPINRLIMMIMFALFTMTPAPVAAQGYVSTDRFAYSGEIHRYSTYQDAVDGANAISGSPFQVPLRDLGLYMVDGNTPFGTATYANSSIFLSAWYLNGGNTPSNQNTGFIQHYDIEGASVFSMDTHWDPTLTTFTFSVLGGNGQTGCTSPGDCGRLWNAGSPLGAASTTAGAYHGYQLSFVATGLATATWNPTTGVYESNSNPTGVTGSIWGLFENTSSTSPESNGWYVINANINLESLYGLNSESVFGSDKIQRVDSTVPEPASMTLLATGLVGLAAARKRKRHSNLKG